MSVPKGPVSPPRKFSEPPLFSDDSPVLVIDELTAAPIRSWEWTVRLWMAAWLGTALAGALFGVGVGLVVAFATLSPLAVIFVGICAVLGGLIAVCIGVFIFGTAAAIGWSTFLTWRFPKFAVGLAGALTGCVCVGFQYPVCIASGAFGAIGAVVAVWTVGPPPQRRWAYSLQNLFARMTVTCVVVACWALLARITFG